MSVAGPVRPTDKDAARRLALASLIGRKNGLIECEVQGCSMGATLPEGCSIRVEPGSPRLLSRGDVIAVAVGKQIMAHRIVRVPGDGAKRPHVLTRGDAHFVPDPPISMEWIIGPVSEVRIGGRWSPVGPAPRKLAYLAAVAALSDTLVAGLMSINLTLADRTAHALIYAANLLHITRKARRT